MTVNIEELRPLPPEEKLRLIALLWDDLAETDQEIPLPAWIDEEAQRRREEMINDPTRSVSHEEMWQRVKNRHG
jgi:putative addiction module component (TIGR02574 family)